MNKYHRSASRSRQAGFTLVEMMVAITIGLVVMFGMTMTFVNLKNTFKSQDSLGQLQDNERLALTFLTTAVNEAGYYPNPKAASTINGSSLSEPWSGNMPSFGIFGTADGGTSTSTESLQTAFSTTSGDGLISCIGTSYAGTSTVTVRNVFYVDPATNSLMCKVYVNGAKTDAMANSGNASVLVSGVKSMGVTYGLAAAGGTQVSIYKAPGSVASTEWGTVKAVRITLNFVNPFDATTPIVRTHTINVMN